jgi:hypothetical protein
LKELRAMGEGDQRLHLLDAWQESPFYSDRERAALTWCEAVTRITEGRVPDEVYELARAQFSETELVNLTLAIVAINGRRTASTSPFAPCREATECGAQPRRQTRGPGADKSCGRSRRSCGGAVSALRGAAIFHAAPRGVIGATSTLIFSLAGNIIFSGRPSVPARLAGAVASQAAPLPAD